MVIANYNNSIAIYVYGVTQYDYGQILLISGVDIPDNTEIHFCQNGKAVTQFIQSNQVQIPDYMLQFSDDVNAYVYHIDESSGKTIKKIVLKIRSREKPGDYVEPEEPAYTRLLPIGGEEGQILSIVDGEYTWIDPPDTEQAPEPVQSDWNNVDVESLAYILNKPTQLSQFKNDCDFVAAVAGAGFMTDVEKAKLGSVESGAQVNSQSDWAVDDTSADEYIHNKPTKLSQFENDRQFIETAVGAGLMSDIEKAKLAGIESGAQVNVQSDWNVSDTNSVQHILNKPTKLSQFSNDTGYISTIGDTIVFDTVRSDNYMFEHKSKVRATFGTPNLLNASLVKGIMTSKFDGYDMDYIHFYSSDTYDGDDWLPYVPGSFTEQRKQALFSGDIATNLYFQLGLHSRFCIEIENTGSTYYWLEYFTLICNSSRSRISFSMEGYSPYNNHWDTIVERQSTGKTSEHYPLEVLHPSMKFDFRVETNKYNRIRYTFYVEQLYDTENLESSYNRLNLYKLRHFGSYPANISSLNNLGAGLYQDENGNGYIMGNFRNTNTTGFTAQDCIPKQYADQTYATQQQLNNILEILKKNNIT